MAEITSKGMQANPKLKDQWLSKPFQRGGGVLMGRITPKGERLFYFRYTSSNKKRVFLPIGAFNPAGIGGLTVKQAVLKASELSAMYQSGITDLKEHISAQLVQQHTAEIERKRLEKEKTEQDALARSRKLTLKQTFERWVSVELKPQTVADGTRRGRKDGGESIRKLFEKRVFPSIGDTLIENIRKADVMLILDTAKSQGVLRTTNVLLASLKQLMRFAMARELITNNPIELLTKRDAGGKDVERDRYLTDDEIRALCKQIPSANLAKRTEIAIWVFLSTGCRISELINAKWNQISFEHKSWHLPETKNQRAHTISLSKFALNQFKELRKLRQLDKRGKLVEFVFPNRAGDGALNVKTMGKQYADRQRTHDEVLSKRSRRMFSLSLTGGPWKPHDLRRTAATIMARIGTSTDVIDECLNHKIISKVSRIYIRDRREAEQAVAFNKLGSELMRIIS
jgi:hypothetical protein